MWIKISGNGVQSSTLNKEAASVSEALVRTTQCHITEYNCTKQIKVKRHINKATDINSLFSLTLKFAVQTNPPVVLQTHKPHTLSQRLFTIVFNIILTLSGVQRGVWVVQTLPEIPKF
jgi:hypothetical protein